MAQERERDQQHSSVNKSMDLRGPREGGEFKPPWVTSSFSRGIMLIETG